MISFFLPMIPRGQGRPRATVRGKHARVYSDPKDHAAQETVASLAAKYLPDAPLEGPLHVEIVVFFPRPAALCKRSARTGEPLQPSEVRWHTSKPDADNCAKLVLDGLRNFWRDDAQISSLIVKKLVCSLDGDYATPGYSVSILTMRSPS